MELAQSTHVQTNHMTEIAAMRGFNTMGSYLQKLI